MPVKKNGAHPNVWRLWMQMRDHLSEEDVAEFYRMWTRMDKLQREAAIERQNMRTFVQERYEQFLRDTQGQEAS